MKTLKVNFAKALFQLGVVKSIGEGRRLIEAGAIDVDGETIRDGFLPPLRFRDGAILKVGKHNFYRLYLEAKAEKING